VAKKTIIHVNQHVIKANRKNNEVNPVLTIKSYNTNEYCHEVEVQGTVRVVYSPDNPLSCGAHVWIETNDNVVIIK